MMIIEMDDKKIAWIYFDHNRFAGSIIYFSTGMANLSLAFGMVDASNLANDGIVAVNRSFVLRMPLLVEPPNIEFVWF